MGNRNCAEASCNALEFRNCGYCLRHKDGRPELSPSPPPIIIAASAEDWDDDQEEDFWKSPFAIPIVILGWLFPPFLLLLIPFYLHSRSTSKKDSELDDGNPDAKSHRGEDIPIAGENPGETELPWWEGLESELN